MKSSHTLHGVGLALRREFLNELREVLPAPVDFLEVTPENWMYVGGDRGKKFAFYLDHYPLVAHGLSLSLGSPAPLNWEFIDDLKIFLDRFQIKHYSEHLSYCSDHHGHLYDLLPIPFTVEAAYYVADRIKKVQHKLERRIAIENITYYCAPGQTVREIDFMIEVLNQADCDLLLDVNNVYVNSQNHGYDPYQFILDLPSDRIAYLHIAGHIKHSENLLLDTHGADIAESVWDLLQFTYETHGVLPTCLERDNHVPPINQLLLETQHIKTLQQRSRRPAYA